LRTNRLLMFRLIRREVIIRRMYSVPEHITMFSAGAAAVGAVYPMIMAHTGGQGIPCPLRTLTGVPCPFCGLTTATVAMAHGEWATAAKTSPLAYLVAALAVGTAPVLAARVFGRASLPRPASDLTRKRVTRVMIVIVALSWLFQLHRYGFI
jgi:glycerol-3-phosphate acyltransferase PlsY